MFIRKAHFQSERLMADVLSRHHDRWRKYTCRFGSGSRVRGHMKAASVAGRSGLRMGASARLGAAFESLGGRRRIAFWPCCASIPRGLARPVTPATSSPPDS
jgi:hypothetical protein